MRRPKLDYKLVRNAAYCLVCGDHVESKSVHDFQQCSCGNIFVDGGLDYLRRGAERIEFYLEDTKWKGT